MSKYFLCVASLVLISISINPNTVSANNVTELETLQQAESDLYLQDLMPSSVDYSFTSNTLSRLVNGIHFRGSFRMKGFGVSKRWHVAYINGSKYAGWLYATGNKQGAGMNGNGDVFYWYEFSGLLEKK